jgi:hypothetical protein
VREKKKRFFSFSFFFGSFVLLFIARSVWMLLTLWGRRDGEQSTTTT